MFCKLRVTSGSLAKHFLHPNSELSPTTAIVQITGTFAFGLWKDAVGSPARRHVVGCPVYRDHTCRCRRGTTSLLSPVELNPLLPAKVSIHDLEPQYLYRSALCYDVDRLAHPPPECPGRTFTPFLARDRPVRRTIGRVGEMRSKKDSAAST